MTTSDIITTLQNPKIVGAWLELHGNRDRHQKHLDTEEGAKGIADELATYIKGSELFGKAKVDGFHWGVTISDYHMNEHTIKGLSSFHIRVLKVNNSYWPHESNAEISRSFMTVLESVGTLEIENWDVKSRFWDKELNLKVNLKELKIKNCYFESEAQLKDTLQGVNLDHLSLEKIYLQPPGRAMYAPTYLVMNLDVLLTPPQKVKRLSLGQAWEVRMGCGDAEKHVPPIPPSAWNHEVERVHIHMGNTSNPDVIKCLEHVFPSIPVQKYETVVLDINYLKYNCNVKEFIKFALNPPEGEFRVRFGVPDAKIGLDRKLDLEEAISPEVLAKLISKDFLI